MRHFHNGTVGSEAAEYAEQVFRTLDINGDGVVDFREYIMAIRMLFEGSAVEKLLVIQAVYKTCVDTALTKPNPLTAEECTNRIFVRLDKDNNGEEIIFSRSIMVFLDDDWIREMLECDPNTEEVERPLRKDTALGTLG
uniref:EF-hand domain-containing protein n=1 Tax=Monopterus albus TaxID=43700 RepID=A0A3Q3IIK4_MONAL